MIKFSKFIHHKPIGKSFSRDHETFELVSTTDGTVTSANVETLSIKHIKDLVPILENAANREHLTTGIPKRIHEVCVAEAHVGDDTVARSNKYFKPSKKSSGLLLIDSDGVNGSPREMLLDVLPMLGGVACIETTSSSSNIYTPFGGELRGECGFHTFYSIDKPVDTQRILDLMHKRLIIAGHNQNKVSSVGGFLERSAIDLMLGIPSQPIYMKASVSSQLEQRKKIIYYDGEKPELLSDDFDDLTGDEEELYQTALTKSKAELADEMLYRRTLWINKQPNTASAERALQDQVLNSDFVLDTRAGPVAVKDLTPEHHGMTCRDPFGDGKGSYTQAKIYNEQDIPMIHSYAHGGVKYRLFDAANAGFGEGEVLVDNDTGEKISSTELISKCGSMFDPALLNSKDQPKSNLFNFTDLLSYYGMKIKLNVITKKVTITGHQSLSENEDKNVTLIRDLCILNDMPVTHVIDYINASAFDNRFNPVVDMVNSKPWDGTDRIKPLFDTLNVISDKPEIEFMLFRKWLCGTLRLGTDVIDEFEYVLVLQALTGGEGKTRWFKKLTVDRSLFVSASFDAKDKDDLIKSTSSWITELGELDSTFVKSEVKALMQHLDNSEDIIRLPYGRVAQNIKRRTAYCGSVNKQEFLIDDSGDRRFWPIKTGDVNYTHDIDMQQVWAQVSTYNEDECAHWLNLEEKKLVVKRNLEFKTTDPVVEKLEVLFSSNIVGEELVFVNTSQVLAKIGIVNPSKYLLGVAKKWLLSRDYKYKQYTINGHRLKGYKIPNFIANPFN